MCDKMSFEKEIKMGVMCPPHYSHSLIYNHLANCYNQKRTVKGQRELGLIH